MKIKERFVGHKKWYDIRSFYHKKWYDKMYGLGVFRKGTVLDDNFHEERCNILLNRNVWFKVIGIKTE